MGRKKLVPEEPVEPATKRGRKKKEVPPVTSIVDTPEKPKKEKTTSNEVVVTQQTEDVKSKKPLKSNGKCALCGKDIYTSPYTIRLTALTSRAEWHRECQAEQLILCSDCAMELNQTIDKFILKKNPKLKKFQIEKTE